MKALQILLVLSAVLTGVWLAAKPEPYVWQATDTSGCTSLGVVTARTLVVMREKGVQTELQRRVAYLGGNAYVMRSANTDPLAEMTTTTAEAFSCDALDHRP